MVPEQVTDATDFDIKYFDTYKVRCSDALAQETLQKALNSSAPKVRQQASGYAKRLLLPTLHSALHPFV